MLFPLVVGSAKRESRLSERCSSTSACMRSFANWTKRSARAASTAKTMHESESFARGTSGTRSGCSSR